jgi:hypothetical protein
MKQRQNTATTTTTTTTTNNNNNNHKTTNNNNNNEGNINAISQANPSLPVREESKIVTMYAIMFR